MSALSIAKWHAKFLHRNCETLLKTANQAVKGMVIPVHLHAISVLRVQNVGYLRLKSLKTLKLGQYNSLNYSTVTFVDLFGIIAWKQISNIFY